MNFADIALKNRVTTLVLTVMMIVGGIASYQGLGRLEDPAFTIKDALVITSYPGATPREVEEEVTDRIEKAVQKLGQIKELESRSEPGRSTVQVKIKDQYDSEALPQVWDELRRKVNDVQAQLPPGAGPSIVVDDFGDVYGIFVAIYGDDYSYAELKEYADFIQRELLLVEDVAKIDFFAARTEAIYIELNRDRMAQLGIPVEAVINELQQRNAVVDAGRVAVGPDFVPIWPTGVIQSVQDFEQILLSGLGSDRQIYLGDIATFHRGYVEPPQNRLIYDGVEAIGLGISTIPDGNVVTMGQGVSARMRELEGQRPIGIEFGIISQQDVTVTESISSFLVNLAEAVVIVVVVLLLFMGVRSGLLIGFILSVTIAGSFILMADQEVQLQRISSGALIIALGMLVDNAIVVVDGMLIKMQQGVAREQAAKEVVAQTAWPLLGATLVAILAFAAIGTSQDSTGEYCRSLFQVIWISLGLSWVTAVTVTPLLGVMFLRVKPPKTDAAGTPEDPYGGRFYRAYKGFLRGCIRLRFVSALVVVGMFAGSIYGFGFVTNSFFPDSTRPQFMVDFRLARGTHIDDTANQAAFVADYLRGLEPVTNVTTVVGGGAMRFLLTYTPEKRDSGYAQFIVDVDDYHVINDLIPEVQDYLDRTHPEATTVAFKFALGPVNWTLSDQKRRVDVAVQVMEGSDVKQVIRALTGAATRHPDVLTEPAPPALLMALGEGALWFSKRLVPDPELSLQLVPYCASLAVIPLLAIVVATISGSRALGVVAGSLMALSPDVAYYSVFVKQYTVDVLAIAGLLLIAVCFFRSREVRYLRLGAGLSIVSLLFSFPSVFAGVVFVNLAALMHVLSNDPAQGRADPTIRTALAFNLVLGRFGRLGQDLTRANRHQAVGGFTRPHEGGRAVVGPFTESQFVVPDHGVERLNSLLRQLDLWLRVGLEQRVDFHNGRDPEVVMPERVGVESGGADVAGPGRHETNHDGEDRVLSTCVSQRV